MVNVRLFDDFIKMLLIALFVLLNKENSTFMRSRFFQNGSLIAGLTSALLMYLFIKSSGIGISFSISNNRSLKD